MSFLVFAHRALLAALIALTFCGFASANDLLVLRFDDTLTGEDGEIPTASSDVSFGPGIHNSAAQFPAPSELQYASVQNINEFEGTFECWVKPSWNGNDGLDHYLLQYGVGGGILIGKDGGNNLRIILNRFGAHPDGEIGVHLNIGNWVAGDWHHIAFTWSGSAKLLQLYIDGQLEREQPFTIDLPAITSAAVWIGSAGGSAHAEASLDDLRISAGVLSQDEILAHVVEGVTIYRWQLEEYDPAELWPGWNWWIQPRIIAETDLGTMQLPMSLANWSSSKPRVAVFEPSTNRVVAVGPGAATLTGTLAGQQDAIDVHVIEPVLEPEEIPIGPFLATPAAGHLYKIPVVILRYFPTTDGEKLDLAICNIDTPLAEIKAKADRVDIQQKFMLEEGSRFRGYGNPAALPTLGYQVLKIITVYEDIPLGFAHPSGDSYFPDYNQIFERWDIDRWVGDFGVQEVWLWQYHYAGSRLNLNESNMSSPTTGDVSNSYLTNGDQPIFDRTYVSYGINMNRQANEAVHNHGHQLERILQHSNFQQDGNTILFWEKFAGLDSNMQWQQGRCGDTHHPPNADSGYDYTNSNWVMSDIEDWTPDQLGVQKEVSASTWGGIPYPWPDGIAPPGATEAQWYIYWMQAMPGRENGIPYGSYTMTDWWRFTGDWDAAVQAGLGLYGPTGCTFDLSSTSESFDSCGGTVQSQVTAAGGCRWIASSNEPWIRVTEGQAGNGSGPVTIAVRINDGPARTGTVAIAGQLFQVTQSEGGMGAPDEVESLTLAGGMEAQLAWAPVSGADYYDLLRGYLTDLSDRRYGPCFRDNLAVASVLDSNDPGPGSGFYYLVRGINGATCAAGPYGYDSDGQERESIDLERCP